MGWLVRTTLAAGSPSKPLGNCLLLRASPQKQATPMKEVQLQRWPAEEESGICQGKQKKAHFGLSRQCYLNPALLEPKKCDNRAILCGFRAFPQFAGYPNHGLWYHADSEIPTKH